MLLYTEDRRKRLMSLVVIAHNSKDIVVGSETMATLDKIGGEKELGRKKIYKINSKAFLTITGGFRERVFQFIADFCYTNRAQQDVKTLAVELARQGVATLYPMQRREFVRFCIAGYIDNKPTFKTVFLKGSEKPQFWEYATNYNATGHTPCMDRANELLKEKGIERELKTSEIKKVVKSVIEQCVVEFPNDLGGSTDIRVIHQR